MGRQLIFDLLARDKTGPATSGAARNLENVGDAADDAAKSTEHLGKEADRAEDKVQRYGRSNRTAAEHVEHLDHEIKLCERELQKLAVAFAEAKTAADRADLSKGMRQTNAELNKLKKNKSVLKDLEGGVDGGKIGKELEKGVDSARPGIVSSLRESLSLGGEAGGPVLAGVIIGALPLIGASISAAVIGGAGIGGVVGGLLLASKDTRVHAAIEDLGSGLKDRLNVAAGSFVQPALDGIAQIKKATDSIGLEAILRNASRFVAPLVAGVSHFVEKVGNGVDKLIANAGPVIEEISNGIAGLGDAIGDVFTDLSKDGISAAVAIDTVFKTLEVTIRIVGKAVDILTDSFGFLARIGVFGREAQTEFMRLSLNAKLAADATDTVTAAQKLAGTVILSTGEAAGKAGMQMQTFADAMDEAASKGRGLYDSQTDVAQAIADTQKALEKNGHTLDLNTQKGRDNRKMLSDLAGKLQANYDAYVKVNGEGGAAQGVAEKNRAAFVRLASQFTRTKGEAEALATSMGLIPANKKTNFYANTHDAEARIAALKGSIGGVHGKTVTVHVSVTGLERLDEAGHRIGGFRASGGSVTAGKAYIVGEKQAEVFVPNQNGTIIPSISKFASGGGMGAASGAGAASLTIDLRGSDTMLGQVFLKALRNNPSLAAASAQYLRVRAS